MGVFYVANVGAGLIGLKLVNVPMFFCIRRLVPACACHERDYRGG